MGEPGLDDACALSSPQERFHGEGATGLHVDHVTSLALLRCG